MIPFSGKGYVELLYKPRGTVQELITHQLPGQQAEGVDSWEKTQKQVDKGRGCAIHGRRWTPNLSYKREAVRSRSGLPGTLELKGRTWDGISVDFILSLPLAG